MPRAPGDEIRLVPRVYLPFLPLLIACGSAERSAPVGRDTLVVFGASSLAVPLRAAMDSFATTADVVVQEEHGASLELARRITELGRVPDVIALADHEVFPELLMPGELSWYATFARNRMVVAYTDRSKYADVAAATDWRTTLLRDDVLVGRTDPVLAPAGYRALLVYALAETFYHQPGLAARLAARTPPRQLRGNAAELAALLSAGELDYIVEYESLARAQKFRFITLPPEIDLGDAAHASTYARATVRVAGGAGKDSVTRTGAPILYGIGVPRRAPHGDVGVRFVAFLLSPDGRAILKHANVDALETPTFVGDSVPAALRSTR